MPFKVLSTVLLCILLSIACHSQQIDITWSDNSKIKNYEDAVQLNNGNYILLKFEELKVFHAYQDLTTDPSLLLVSPSMNILKENKFSIGDKNDFGHRLIKWGSNVFLMYQVFGKGSNTTYVYAVKGNISHKQIYSYRHETQVAIPTYM